MNESFNGELHKSIDPSPYQTQIGITCSVALKCGLNREQTIKLVENVFTNPAKAPEEINVKFISENISQLTQHLSSIDNKYFGPTIHFTQNILESKNPFELVFFHNSQRGYNIMIENLRKSLDTNIKKEGFKVFYENNIFYINNFDILNEHNKNVVLTKLQQYGAINIATQLKWARTLS